MPLQGGVNLLIDDASGEAFFNSDNKLVPGDKTSEYSLCIEHWETVMIIIFKRAVDEADGFELIEVNHILRHDFRSGYVLELAFEFIREEWNPLQLD